MFYSYVYNDNKNIDKLIKKTLNEKCLKHLYIYWTKLKTENLATAKQLIRKNCLSFKKIELFFHRANAQIGLTPLLAFVRFLKTLLPPPQRTYFWNAPCVFSKTCDQPVK